MTIRRRPAPISSKAPSGPPSNTGPFFSQARPSCEVAIPVRIYTHGGKERNTFDGGKTVHKSVVHTLHTKRIEQTEEVVRYLQHHLGRSGTTTFHCRYSVCSTTILTSSGPRVNGRQSKVVQSLPMEFRQFECVRVPARCRESERGKHPVNTFHKQSRFFCVLHRPATRTKRASSPGLSPVQATFVEAQAVPQPPRNPHQARRCFIPRNKPESQWVTSNYSGYVLDASTHRS